MMIVCFVSLSFGVLVAIFLVLPVRFSFASHTVSAGRVIFLKLSSMERLWVSEVVVGVSILIHSYSGLYNWEIRIHEGSIFRNSHKSSVGLSSHVACIERLMTSLNWHAFLFFRNSKNAFSLIPQMVDRTINVVASNKVTGHRWGCQEKNGENKERSFKLHFRLNKFKSFVLIGN